MDELAQASTTAFHTLDAFNGELAGTMMPSVEQAIEGHDQAWEALVSTNDDLRARLIGQGRQTARKIRHHRMGPSNVAVHMLCGVNERQATASVGRNDDTRAFWQVPLR